jgi:hypothetical protein
MSRALPQLIVFSYHKSGTSLLFHVMTKVCERLGLSLVNHFGLVDNLGPEPDVVLLPHSLLRAPLDWPYRAIRMIRDPRDIWVSGYLYHRHSDERWCIETNLDPTPPIGWPQVDHSFAHLTEAWKRHYLDRLNGKSYQRNLLELSLADGLAFELEGYSGCTFAAMRDWPLNGADALDIKLEDAMADFDTTMWRIFDHFGFDPDQSEAALEVACSEDVRRMDEAAIANRPQIHSRVISKWRNILSEDQIAGFEALHGDLIRELGYDMAGEDATFPEPMDAGVWFTDSDRPLAIAVEEVRLIWPGLTDPPEAIEPAVARGADVRLSADGVTIRPMVSRQGSYSFVVSPGTRQICLRSRRSAQIDASAPYLGSVRYLGVKVSEILIRSRSGEVVIPADDPRLIQGWHEVEQAGLCLWRWTNGLAELPWSGISGPAVVIVHCTALEEYPAHDEACLVVADRDEGAAG